MAERLSDSTDRMLDAVFRSGPIADNGFSGAIVKRIRRRLWLERLTVPVAFVIGLAIAAKPALQLFDVLKPVLNVIPTDVTGLSVDMLPQLQTFALAGILLAGGMVLVRVLAD